MPRKKKIEEAVETEVTTEVIAEEVPVRKVREGAFSEIMAAGSACDVEFEVRPYLSLTETIEFVDYVTDMVFTGHIYRPALLDYAMGVAMIIYFTDIDIPEGDGAAEEINALINTTDVIGEIVDRLPNSSQYYNLMNAATDSIDNKNEFINHYNHAHDEMFENISILANTAAAWIDKLGGMLERKIKKLRLDPESVKDIQALSRKVKKLDEKELIKGIVEYSKEKSDEDGKVIPFNKKDK